MKPCERASAIGTRKKPAERRVSVADRQFRSWKAARNGSGHQPLDCIADLLRGVEQVVVVTGDYLSPF